MQDWLKYVNLIGDNKYMLPLLGTCHAVCGPGPACGSNHASVAVALYRCYWLCLQ